MSYPANARFSKEHEWVVVEGNKGTVGITRYAVDQLGDVVHIDLPKVGAAFKAGESFGTIESTKTVSDLYMPVDAKVVEVNKSLGDAPEKVSEDPHGSAWIVKVELSGDAKGLMTAAEYEKYIA